MVGDIVVLPEWLGSAQIKLIDEYRPGVWQVEAIVNGAQFLISFSTHRDADAVPERFQRALAPVVQFR